MNIKASELKTYLSKHKTEMERGSAWIDSMPSDINSAFFDNTYVNSLDTQISLTQKMLFGDLYEDISWFLYEWNPKHGVITMPDGTSYNIQTLDDYISYLIDEHFVEDDINE